MKRIVSLLAALVLAMSGAVLINAQPAMAVDCSGSGAGGGVIGFYNTTSDFINGYNAITCMSSAPLGECQVVSPDNVTSHLANGTVWAWYWYGTSNCTGTRGIIYHNSTLIPPQLRDNWIGSTYRSSCIDNSC